MTPIFRFATKLADTIETIETPLRLEAISSRSESELNYTSETFRNSRSFASWISWDLSYLLSGSEKPSRIKKYYHHHDISTISYLSRSHFFIWYFTEFTLELCLKFKTGYLKNQILSKSIQLKPKHIKLNQSKDMEPADTRADDFKLYLELSSEDVSTWTNVLDSNFYYFQLLRLTHPFRTGHQVLVQGHS